MATKKTNSEDGTVKPEASNESEQQGSEFIMPEADGVESGVPHFDSNAVKPELNVQGFNQRQQQAQQQIATPEHTLSTSNRSSRQGSISIKAKLIGSMSILTLLIVLIGIVAYRSIVETNEFSLSITDEYAALARLSEEMKSSIYRIRSAEKDFLLLEEQEALGRSTREITKIRSQLEKATVLGDAIASKTDIDVVSQYQDLADKIDEYEQQFSAQVKSVVAARSEINKDITETKTGKKELIIEVDKLAELITDSVNEYWLTAQSNISSTTDIAAAEKNIVLGVKMAELDHLILQAKVQIARYLQLNQQIYVDSALRALNDLSNAAINIRQQSVDNTLIVQIKKIISATADYQLNFKAVVTLNTDVLNKKTTVDLQIANQKESLKKSGDQLLGFSEELSKSAWQSIASISKELRDLGEKTQTYMLTLLIVGTAIGIAVLILVPRPILNNINQLLVAAQAVAGGDLTQSVTVDSQDELGELADNFEVMRGNLVGLVDRIQRASVQMTSTINEIQAASNQQTSASNEQSSAITQFNSTITEMAQVSEQLSQSSSSMAEDAGSVSRSVDDSAQSANQTLESMTAIGESTRQTSERIKALNDQMDGINDAVTTISSVADQTTLLSLNAAIEANKAGEMGKGFSVVATEIRRLSDRSIESANSIAQMVRDIQRATESSVVSMDKSSEEIKQGISLVSQTADTMLSLNQSIETIRNQTQDMASSTAEQAAASNETQNTMGQMMSNATLSASAASQSSSAAYELASTASQLADAVAAFKI